MPESQERLSQHTPEPKRELYEQVYDPLTNGWFGEFFALENLKKLEKETHGMTTVDMLKRHNHSFHSTVDDLFDNVEHAELIGDAIKVVATYHKDVIWGGQMVPENGASLEEIEASLRHKFKRNISLALLEALALLESGVELILSKIPPEVEVDLAASMRHSHDLYARLARLHEAHAVVRWKKMTDAPEIKYPEVSIEDILAERNIIGGEYLKLIPHDDNPHIFKVGFIETPREWRDQAEADEEYSESTKTLTMVCPAQRFGPATDQEGQLQPHISHNRAKKVWNGHFWGLLIDIYERSGRFEELRRKKFGY